MFAPLSGFSARLTQGVNPTVRRLHVGPVAAGQVAATLLPGEWSYALLRDSCRIEVVKVTGAAADYVIVERGQSGTDRSAFDVDTVLEYSFTYAEAIDRVTAALGEIGLSLIGGAAVTIDSAGQTFNVSIPTTAIAVDCTAQVVGEGDKIQIGQVIEAYGCCEVRVPSLPPFVYLTSRPYPIDVVEALSTSGLVIDATLFQASTEAVAVSGLVITGNLQELLRSVLMIDEAIATEALVLSGTLRTALLSASMVDEAIATSGLVVSGNLRNLLVSYVMVDEAIATSGLVVSGVLTVP